MAVFPSSLNETVSLVADAPQVYADWWMRQFQDNPSRIVLETSLILAVVLLAFMRPRAKRAEFKLSRAEVEGLLADWTPEPWSARSWKKTARATASPPGLTSCCLRKLGSTVLTSDGAELIDFCTFDFLGLSCDEDVKAACIGARQSRLWVVRPTASMGRWTSTST